jgi:hypothetical protein
VHLSRQFRDEKQAWAAGGVMTVSASSVSSTMERECAQEDVIAGHNASPLPANVSVEY